jgi:hypothetical protein
MVKLPFIRLWDGGLFLAPEKTSPTAGRMKKDIFINFSFIDDYSISFKRANWMMHLLVSRSISSRIPFHSALKKTDKNLSF